MKKIIAVFSLLVIALSACNFPTAQDSGLTIEQQAATVVAQTLTAIAAENPVPLASPTLGATKTPLASPTSSEAAPTIQPNATPTGTAGTPGATLLTVDSNTNCREGPGLDFVIVIVLVPGTNYQMIARTADNKYWVVTEIGKSNACWVPAEMSNAFGNVNLLPVTTPSAPTSAAGALQAPTFPKNGWSYFCYGTGQTDISLQWTDNADNETGYRVIRDGVIVAELPVNSTSFLETISLASGQSVSYQIQVYNAASFAYSSVATMTCP